jgi:hypothetical protein
MDARTLLREADAMLKANEIDLALRGYAQVARYFAEQGFALKAIAVWGQVREIIRKHALSTHPLEREAREQLPKLLRSLGLEQDARAIEEDAAVWS